MIQTLRDERGISQQELANKLNINRSLLSHIETGKVLPSMDTLIKIARILNCLVIDLYKEEDLNIIKTMGVKRPIPPTNKQDYRSLK